MKKTILATAMMLMAGLTVAFAKDNEGVNNQIASSFHKDFTSATNISWSVQKDFTKATFTMNSQVMFAFYNEDGNLIATARNILSEQLPINLLKSIRKDYGNYWISDLFEIDKDGQVSYYVTVENADETLVLKSNSYGDWSTYKKAKKI